MWQEPDMRPVELPAQHTSSNIIEELFFAGLMACATTALATWLFRALLPSSVAASGPGLVCAIYGTFAYRSAEHRSLAALNTSVVRPDEIASALREGMARSLAACGTLFASMVCTLMTFGQSFARLLDLSVGWNLLFSVVGSVTSLLLNLRLAAIADRNLTRNEFWYGMLRNPDGRIPLTLGQAIGVIIGAFFAYVSPLITNAFLILPSNH